MNIRRILFLCLLTFTLGVTGPLARGLSAQAAALPTAELAQPGATTNLKAAASPTKRCQRGAAVRSNCATDPGYLPGPLQTGLTGAGRAFEPAPVATTSCRSHSRLFRPPRSS